MPRGTRKRQREPEPELRDSSADNTHQTDSWVPPASSKKHLTPDAEMTNRRRASLRSAKRVIQAEACSETKFDKTMEKSIPTLEQMSQSKRSTSKSPHPQKSREDLSAIDGYPQLENIIDNVITSVSQAPRDSPTSFANYLVKLSKSIRSGRNENVEQAGDFENEDVPDDEMSISKSLPQIEGPDTASNLIIAEQVPLPEVIGASNTVEERTKECEIKSPFQTLSFGLTELVNKSIPSGRNENVEQVGDFENEKVPDDEMSISKSLPQIEGPDNASNLIIAEQVPLLEVNGASKTVKERAKVCEIKSPLRTLSFGLTELANMCGDESSSDNEVDSSFATIQGYRVKEESVPILSLVFKKYGDITKNCIFVRAEFRSHILDIISETIRKLQAKQLTQVTEVEVKQMIDLVIDLAENGKVELGWLHQRLVEILEGIQLIKQSRTLKEEREENAQNIENAKREREGLKAEIMALEQKISLMREKLAVAEETLAIEMEKYNRIREIIFNAKSKIGRLYQRSLVDGLF